MARVLCCVCCWLSRRRRRRRRRRGRRRRLAATAATAAVAGGTSELCPYQPLVKAGATVVVVSRPGAKIQALVSSARRLSSGTVLVPLSREQQAGEGDDDDASLATVAGCDVITQAPQLIAWLSALLPEKTMVLGSYIYIDGK